MLKACSRCGKIHSYNYKCYKGISIDKESKLRKKYIWNKKSEEIREASNYLCSICFDNGRYTYEDIDTHHIDKLKDRPDRWLDNYNLIALCREHHKLADDGKIDKDYLFKLAKAREENTPPYGQNGKKSN